MPVTAGRVEAAGARRSHGTMRPAASLAQRLTRSLGLQAVLRLFALAVGFVSLSLTSRFLATHEYGQLASAYALTGLFTLLADLGVNSQVLRRANVHGEDLGMLTRQSLGLTLVYVGPVTLAFLIAGYTMYDGAAYQLLRGALPAYAVGLVATCLSTSLRPLYQQQIRLGYTAVVELVTGVLSAASYVVLVSTGAPAMTIFYIQALYPVVGLVLLVLGQRGVNLVPVVDARAGRRLLVESLPTGLAMIVAGVYLRIDVLILAALVTASAVGAYGLAYRIVSSIGVVSVYIGSTLFPRLASLRSDRRAYRSAYTRSLAATLMLAIPMAVGGVLTASPVVTLVSGSGYDDAVMPLRILFLAVVPIFVNGLMGNALVLSGKASWFLRMSTACLVANVVLNLALIPRYGITGAAFATLATECLTTATIGWALRGDVDVRRLGALFSRLVPANVCLGVVVWFATSRIPVLWTVLAGVLVYAAALVVLRMPGALGVLLGRRGAPVEPGSLPSSG